MVNKFEDVQGGPCVVGSPYGERNRAGAAGGSMYGNVPMWAGLGPGAPV